MPNHPVGAEPLPSIQPELPPAQFRALPSGRVTGHQERAGIPLPFLRISQPEIPSPIPFLSSPTLQQQQHTTEQPGPSRSSPDQETNLPRYFLVLRPTSSNAGQGGLVQGKAAKGRKARAAQSPQEPGRRETRPDPGPDPAARVPRAGLAPLLGASRASGTRRCHQRPLPSHPPRAPRATCGGARPHHHLQARRRPPTAQAPAPPPSRTAPWDS